MVKNSLALESQTCYFLWHCSTLCWVTWLLSLFVQPILLALTFSQYLVSDDNCSFSNVWTFSSSFSDLSSILPMRTSIFCIPEKATTQLGQNQATFFGNWDRISTWVLNILYNDDILTKPTSNIQHFYSNIQYFVTSFASLPRPITSFISVGNSLHNRLIRFKFGMFYRSVLHFRRVFDQVQEIGPLTYFLWNGTVFVVRQICLHVSVEQQI